MLAGGIKQATEVTSRPPGKTFGVNAHLPEEDGFC